MDASESSQRPSSSSRHHHRSLTTPLHLSFSPLNPSRDEAAMADSTVSTHHNHHVSYIEGRSAPTTPKILSRSSSRVNMTRLSGIDGLSKSKSSINITSGRGTRSGTTTPRSRAPRTPRNGETALERIDSDWLLRAGAVISSEARESKGQGWLVSRASSTSLMAQDDDTDEEQSEAWETHRGSRKHSRRGSMADDESSPIATRFSFGPGSRPLSRYNSRPQSRKGSRAHILVTPTEREREGYFDIPEEFVAEPDFVDVDEEVYADQGADDDVLIKRLVKRNTFGLGGVLQSVLGWSLFSLNEDGEDSDNNTETGDDEQGDESEVSTTTRSSTQGWVRNNPTDDNDIKVPPPGEQSEGWQDAAWLLSVASKVLL